MASRRLRLLNLLGRRVLRPRIARTPTPAAARADFERVARLFLAPPPFCLVLGDPDMEWVSVGRPEPGRVILYFHGGAYICGSPRTHLALAGRIAALAGLRVALPCYPLAPEHPAPAAFAAACAAHRRLLALGYRPGDIVLGGDSAGGGLALALMAHLTGAGLAPAGLFAFSPWTDLTGSGVSVRANAAADRLLDPARLEEIVGYVTGDGALPTRDPRISPLFAALEAPPPVWMSVARTEILLDDARRMAERLRAAGGEVEMSELPDAPHVWALFDGYVPEARATIAAAAGFARDALALP